MNEPTEPPSTRPKADETRATLDGWPIDGRISAVPADETIALERFEAASAPATVGGRFGEYELGRELGRGGMGVVFEARHVDLNRSVALKTIRSGVLADAAEIQRFHVEAEALARLDHPGIVPMYEVGEFRGQAFLAMKLAAGGSLANRLDQYRDAPRAAAELTADVAEAVQHAHSRGILHRDLKPANVLVDADGRPMVTDFGLAKRFQEDSSMTVTGAVVGTPAFMSPEQAAGRRGAITTAADVYGLGAILYSLLAGRPPLVGEDVTETLDAIRERTPEPPSRHNPGVPRDLDTIVLKCLEKEPRRRYASARDLADDLRAWLDSRPIAARRVGPAERAWLWCRRRPAVAGLAAAVALASVGGAAAVLLVQSRANAELKAANAREHDRFQLAMDAVESLGGRIVKDPALKEPRFAPLRAGLLNQAAGFYDRLAVMLKDRDDPSSLETLAEARYGLGELTEQTGSKLDALGMHEEALATRASAAARGELDDRLDLARSLVAVGRLRSAVGRAEGATAALREAVRTAVGESPEALDLRATALEALADQAVMATRPDAARAAFVEATAIRRLAPASPALEHRRAALAESFGVFEVQSGRAAAAASRFDEAEAILTRLARSDPDASDVRSDLAGVLMARAALEGQLLGRPDESLASLEKARAILAAAVAERPALVAPRAKLADCEPWLILAYWNLGRLGPAMETAAAYAADAETLLLIDPGSTVHRSRAASALTARALIFSRLGRRAEALPLFQRARETYESIAGDAPSNSRQRFDTISADVNVANELRLLGRSAEALPIAERAAATAEGFRDETADLALVQMHLGEAARQLAEVRLALGDPAGAAASVRRAVEVLSAPPPKVLQTYYEQAAALAVLADLAETSGSGVAADEGPPAAAAAVAALGKVRDLGFRNVAALEGETAFASLRGRADYRAIMADMVFSGDVFAPPSSR